MLQVLRQRWQVIPTWAKVVPIVVLVVGLSVWEQWDPAHRSLLAPAVHRLFFLPLFMASLLFGLRGGLICAGVISLNFLPALVGGPHPGGPGRLELGIEVLLYFGTAAVTGMLVDRERREAQRLKEAENLALLGETAAAVAHELKNPLVAIGGFAQRLHRDLEPDHPHRPKLEIIVDQVAHMEQMLRDMLDYSRPLKLNLAPQPLGALVEEVMGLCSLLAQEAGVRLVSRLEDGPARPMMDGARIKQVLLNLVQNAVQASPRGGVVEVRARRQGRQAVVEVSDQGPGVPREHRDKLFSPFFTTKQGGTGLGLAISRKIVVAHGGCLELAEARRQGSTFVMTLPIKGPDGPAPRLERMARG